MPPQQLHDKTSSSIGGPQFSLDYWVWVCSLSGFKFKQSFNLYRNYYPALLPLLPLVQTLPPESFWRRWYETFERMDNLMEGQEVFAVTQGWWSFQGNEKVYHLCSVQMDTITILTTDDDTWWMRFCMILFTQRIIHKRHICVLVYVLRGHELPKTRCALRMVSSKVRSLRRLQWLRDKHG